MTERLKSGVPQAVNGALLCAVESCTWVAPPGERLCVNHVATRDARTDVMKQIAVAGGFVTEGLSFGDALRSLKAGKRVARAGWNGKGMWLALQVPDENSKMRHPYVYLTDVAGKPVPWNPNNLDMLAEDWSVVT